MTPPAESTEAQSAESAMLRLASGDKGAFDQVFNTVWPPALRYAAHLLGSASAAEDVAQRAVLRLFEEAPGYRPGAPVIAWALNLTYWEARTELRKQRRAKTEPWGDRELVDQAEGALDGLIDREAQLQLQRLLAELPEDEKSLLGLADSLVLFQLQPSTVRKRRQRLLERIKRGLLDLIPGDSNDD